MKAKYFPNTTFYEANITSKLSYTWHNILFGIELFFKGANKIISSGYETKIATDPWIPRPWTFKPSTNPPACFGHWKVANLINANHSWDCHKLNIIFSFQDIDIIINIPIPLIGGPDSWAWFHDHKGSFSVKSAYHFHNKWSIENEEGSSSHETSRSFIWSLI